MLVEQSICSCSVAGTVDLVLFRWRNSRSFLSGWWNNRSFSGLLVEQSFLVGSFGGTIVLILFARNKQLQNYCR